MALDAAFWENEHRQLLAILQPRLAQMALSGMVNAARQVGIAFDATLYNQRAEAWARTYTDQLLAELGTTTETVVGNAVADWIARPGATVGELNAALTPAFGQDRASLIAVTESTRAFANGQEEAYKAEGITHIRWNSNNDELQCPYCGAINKKIVQIGQPFGVFRGKPVLRPPYHPNCRCWISPVISPDQSNRSPIFTQILQWPTK